MANLPCSLVTKACPISKAQGALLGDEARLLEGANVARQRELIAGRTVAHVIMFEMGLAEAPVGQNADGSPAWPAGLCGSIAHSHHDIAVAIARLSDVRAVGIDIEDGRDLEGATPDIVSELEIEGATTHPLASDRQGAVRILFSMKEALFKCQAPITGNSNLSFTAIRLISRPESRFGAEAVGDLGSPIVDVVSRIQIELQQIQGVVVATAWLPADLHFV